MITPLPFTLPPIHYYKEVSHLAFSRYVEDNSICLLAYQTEDLSGPPITKLTVCIPGTNLDPDEILVKSWGTNAGVFQALCLHLAEPTGRAVPAGYELAHIMQLSPTLAHYIASHKL